MCVYACACVFVSVAWYSSNNSPFPGCLSNSHYVLKLLPIITGGNTCTDKCMKQEVDGKMGH